MSATPFTRSLVIAIFSMIALGLIASTSFNGSEATLPDAPDALINCASYTPSHDGRIRYNLQVPREAIVADLKILAAHVRCVRTYTANEGLDQVPEIARELGLKVMLGLWISADAKSNAAEIARGIALARAHSDVIEAVIVGNEVLLRRELTATQLRTLIEQVRAATTVPVTYADVWEFWLRNAALADATSFVTVHILPYWEDHPIGIEHALDHVRSIYRKVREAFPGQRVFIGETGWPSEGRPRLDATPSLLNEARFIRELMVWAHAEQIPYNIIEAFDQPWKRAQEGIVGGYWGLFDANAQQKFSLTGAMSTRNDWRIALLAAMLCASIFVAVGWAQQPRLSQQALLLLGSAGLAAGSVALTQWHYLITANRTWLDWLATTSWATVGWFSYVFTCSGLARWIDGQRLLAIPGMATVLNSIGHSAKISAHYGARLLGALRVAMLFGATYVSLGLVFEGRGRDFPLSLLGLPVLGLAVYSLCESRSECQDSDNEELLMSVLLLVCSGIVLWIETLANTRAIMWSVLCTLFAVATIKSSAGKSFFGSRAHPGQHA